MTKKVIRTDALSAPIAHFSRGVRVGNRVLISATAGLDPQKRLVGRTPGRTDTEAQTDQMLKNVGQALELLRSGLDDVVRVRGFLIDWRDKDLYNQACARHFRQPYPARSSVATSLFAMPQLQVEVQLEALIGGGKKAVQSDRLAPVETPEAQAGVVSDGSFFTVQGPFDYSGHVVGGGSIESQTNRSLENLLVALEAAGLCAADLVMVTAALTDVRNYSPFDDSYRTFLSPPYPARSVVFTKLSDPAQLVELEAIAVRGSRSYIVSARDQAPLGESVLASDDLPPSVGASAAGVMRGDMLYVGAQIGVHRDGQMAKGITEQTLRAMRNVEAVARQVGLTLEDVVETTVVLSDVRLYQGFNAGYGPLFDPPYPARATIEGQLVREDALVQIEARLSPLARDASFLTVGS